MLMFKFPSRTSPPISLALCSLLVVLSMGCGEASPPEETPPAEEVLEYDGLETPAELDRMSAHILSNQLLGALALIRATNPETFLHSDVVPRMPALPWADLPPGTPSLIADAAAPAAMPAGASPQELFIPLAATRDAAGISRLPLSGLGEEQQVEGEGWCDDAAQSASYQGRVGGNTGVGRLSQDFDECDDGDTFIHHGSVETHILATENDPAGQPGDRLATWVEHHFDGFEYDDRSKYDTRLALKGVITHRNDPDLQELHTQIESLVVRNRIDENMTMLLENVEERIRIFDGTEYRSLAGRFYSEDHGWVDFALAPAVRWGGGPTREPTLALFLSAGSPAQTIITHESGRGPAIELDQDGNAAVEAARLASRHTRPDDDLGGPPVPEAQADHSIFENLEVDTTVRVNSSLSRYGRPGLLTHVWSAVSAPEGEPPIFSDPAGFSTEVTFVERGPYQLTLELQDGPKESDPFYIAATVQPEKPLWNRVEWNIPRVATVGVPWQGSIDVRLAGDPFIEYEITSGPDGLTIDSEGVLRWDDPMAAGRFFEAFESPVSLRVYNGHETIFRSISIKVQTGAGAPIIRTGSAPPRSDSALQVADFDGDGVSDLLVSDRYFHFYVLSPDGQGGWAQSWVHPEDLGVRSFHAVDADGDDAHEVYLHFARGVARVDGATRSRTIPITFSSGLAHGIRVADVDADSELEIVTLHGNFEDESQTTLSVHDLATSTLEWSVAGTNMGERVRVGQLDADPALEIVLDGYGVVDGAGPATPGGPHPPQWNPGIGLGNPFDVGNVDADAFDEIVAGVSGTDDLTVYDVQGQQVQLTDDLGHEIVDVVVADSNASGPAEAIIASTDPADAVVFDVSGASAVEQWSVSHAAHSADHIAVGNVDADAEVELVWAADADSGPDLLLVADSGGVEWSTPDSQLYDWYFVGGEGADITGLGTQLLFASAFDRAGSSGRLRMLALTPDTGEIVAGPTLRSSGWSPNSSTGMGISPGSFLQNGETELAFLSDGGALPGPPPQRVGFYDFVSESELAPFGSSTGQSHPRRGNADADALDELFVIRGTVITMLDPNDDRSIDASVDTTEAIIDFEVTDFEGDGDADLLVLTDTSLLHYEWVADALVERGTWTDGQPLLHLELGDANGDGNDELVITNGALGWILSPALTEIASYPLPYPNHGALVVDPDSPSGPGIILARGEVVEIDAMTGELRWISPALMGDTTPEGLHLHDDGAGGSFLSIATTRAIYITR
jgi:hypothetical protein